MAGYELLKAKSGTSHYLSVRPPLCQKLYMNVAAALGMQNVYFNAHVLAQVGGTTEFSWTGRLGPIAEEHLASMAHQAITALVRLGEDAALISDETITIDGPIDAFQQYESQQCAY